MAEAGDRWRTLAETAIGGSLETLTRGSRDGVAIQPLYERDTTDRPRPWRRAGAWRVAQRVDHPDPEQANRLALLDLDGGADALTLVSAGSPYSRGFGLPPAAEAFNLALDTIELDLIATRLDAGSETIEASEALAKIVEDRRLTSAALDLDLGYDPIGVMARTGRDQAREGLQRILDLNTAAGFAGHPLLADGRPSHEAGAEPAQELAAILATAVAYLRRLDSLRVTLDAARRLVAVLVVTDAEALVALAKVRAIRRLWARVEAASGLTPEPLQVHAETSWRTMSRYDPWVNVMRATAGIFAAGLGGADVVTALPFTLALGLPDDGARRLARNAQRVLIDEAHLDAVDDPAGGSGGLEALTDGLCATAWTLFQEIEREGGIEASLAAGRWQARLAAAAHARAASIAMLGTGLVGTSRFPSMDSPSIGVLDVKARLTPAPSPRALPAIRDAEPFEALRDRVEALEPRPKVFLATLGAPAAFGPHAIYAANFFAIAGFTADRVAERRSIDDQIATFRSSGTPVVCVCAASLDDAEAAARAFRDADATYVLAVGRPGDKLAHADAIIHEGCDALTILGDVLVQAGLLKGTG